MFTARINTAAGPVYIDFHADDLADAEAIAAGYAAQHCPPGSTVALIDPEW